MKKRFVSIAKIAGVCILLSLIFSPKLSAQGTILVETNVDKSTITIGDIVRYTLLVKHSKDVQVDMPASGVNLGMFEIQDYEIKEPEKKDGMLVEVVTFQISVYDTGSYVIPPVLVEYQVEGDSLRQAMQSEEVAIRVDSVKPSEADDIQDVKAPLAVPPDYTLYYWIGGLALLLLLIAATIYIYLKKYRKGPVTFFAPPPPRPAHELAYEALDGLEQSSLLTEGRFKEYYIRISEIIRIYLSQRYEIDVLEMTTYELIETLRKVYDIDAKHIDLIYEFMSTCDLVKFAKHIPADDDCRRIMTASRKIVDETKRIFIEPPAMTPVTEEKSPAMQGA